MNTSAIQNRIRFAVQDLHKEYQESPWMFITEGDIQCNLFAYLKSQAMRGARHAKVFDRKSGKRLKQRKWAILTRPLHAEMHMWDERREFADICIADPFSMKFGINTDKFNSEEGLYRIANYEWSKEDFIGIEIKFNKWTSRYKTEDGKVTKNVEAWARTIAKDLKKLKGYKKGWLIFVDQCSLFKNQAEWRAFFKEVLGKIANSGWPKRSINGFYLAPKHGLAWCYKPWWRS